MDRSWMQVSNRLSREYIKGVDDFLDFASTNDNKKGVILCPCKKCNNVLHFTKEEVKAHLIMNGIVKSYTRWYYHGESFVQDDHFVDELVPGEGCGRMIDLIKDVRGPEVVDSIMHDASEEDIVQPDLEEPPKHNGTTGKFFRLLEDAEQKLYPNCENFTKLSFIVKLFQIKCLYGISDTAIEDILKLFKEALPAGETLPKSFYKARRMIKDLGLDYREIEACRNDCMLFWKEYEDLQNCLHCGEPRYKVEENCKKLPKGKGVPYKVLRYFPLTPRLQRLFMSSEVASSMRWHHDQRLKDGVLRHPADSEVWRSFDKANPGFSREPRNVRIGLSADGVNPFGNMDSSHSTWPVIVTAYNLPPWMCMKQSYCMMSLLIPGPKAPGNDIDVYLQPLVEELKELWMEYKGSISMSFMQ
ncbi:unnamed protein product [Linum trigynum]|uniref:Transposase-associated domain-containing protein n=1 Tax=Linum trigynum TaxID=586398 RepID=A0AAV2EVQ3_9ROSI